MLLSKADINALDDDALERLIFPNEPVIEIPHCQAALVLGTSKPNIDRTPEAIMQYKNGVCDKLVFSGGVYWDTEYGKVTEAEYMRRYALENGVDDKDIILDEIARTTIENMLTGALAINRGFDYVSDVKNLLLVTSSYHMRRSMFLAEALLPRNMKIYPCHAYGVTDRNNWRDSDLGHRRVKAEAGYIKAMAIHGLIDDIDL